MPYTIVGDCEADTSGKGRHRLDWHLFLLASSIILNLLLWTSLLVTRRHSPLAPPVASERASPNGIDRLSEVAFLILEPDERGLAELERSMASWRENPPCLLDSYPTAAFGSEIALSIYSAGSLTPEGKHRVRGALKQLPKRVQACFSGLMVVELGVRETDNRAQLAFADLLFRKHMQPGTAYVLVLAPGTVAIQPNWLNLVDIQCRPPNEPFWVKGSIFRGDLGTDGAKPPPDVAFLAGVAPSALYNFGSAYFVDFYKSFVLPWTAEKEKHAITEKDNNLGQDPIDQPPQGNYRHLIDLHWALNIYRFLADWRDTDAIFRQLVHFFHHSEFIGDFMGTRNTSLAQLAAHHPQMLLVHAAAVLP